VEVLPSPSPARPPAPVPTTAQPPPIADSASVSPPLWTVIPEPPPSQADPILAALAADKAARQKVWDSKAIAGDDRSFEPDEKSILAELPAFLLHKDEHDFGELVRALQEVAQFAKRFRAGDPAAIKEFFAAELRRLNKKVSVAMADTLTVNLLVLGEPGVSRTLRLRTITTLGLLYLTLSDEHRSRVPRLRIALISRPPASTKEVAGWLKSGRIATRSDLSVLPVASDGLDF
jgi:hypothetical protein